MPVTEASNKYKMKSFCSGTQNGHYMHFLYISKIMLIIKKISMGKEKRKKRELQLMWEARLSVARLLLISTI